MKTMRTSIGNHYVQTIRDLSDFINGLPVAFFIIRNQLDDMNVRVLLRECVQRVSGRRVSSPGKEDGVGESLEEGLNEVKANPSVGARDCGCTSEFE